MAEAGELILVSTVSDQSVRAYGRKDGLERWRFYADAAIRTAPVVATGAVLVGSDDGTVACLDLLTGQLRPGPSTRQVIAHLRLQSSWPIVTPLTIEGDMVLGVCGVFPDDGVWIFAVDLRDGKERWLQRLSQRVQQAVISDGKKCKLPVLSATRKSFIVRPENDFRL